MDKNKSLENSWKVVTWNFASNSLAKLSLKKTTKGQEIPSSLLASLTFYTQVTAHLYFLRQLKHAKVPANDLLSLYTTCICPVAEYACPVFDTALPQYLSNQLEHQQKWALCIISTNDLSYRQALEVFSISTWREIAPNTGANATKSWKLVTKLATRMFHHNLT